MGKFSHFCYLESYCAVLPWRGAFWQKIMFEFTGMLVSQNSFFLLKCPIVYPNHTWLIGSVAQYPRPAPG